MQKIEVAAKTVAVLLGGKCLVDDSVFQALSTVDIGCQRVQRWELEEAALHYGWEFPS